MLEENATPIDSPAMVDLDCYLNPPPIDVGDLVDNTKSAQGCPSSSKSKGKLSRWSQVDDYLFKHNVDQVGFLAEAIKAVRDCVATLGMEGKVEYNKYILSMVLKLGSRENLSQHE